MRVNKNKTIADQYTIVNVNSTRDILNWQDNKFDNITGLLVGGISYDLNPIDSTASVNDISMASNSHDSELRGLMHPSEDWTSLPGTIHEIDAISKLLSSKGFNYTVFEDTAATELKIKEVGNKSPEETSPTLIHFSTHGYFFPDKKEVTSSAIWKNEDPIFKTSEHPLIRSGLILAGGIMPGSMDIPLSRVWKTEYLQRMKLARWISVIRNWLSFLHVKPVWGYQRE